MVSPELQQHLRSIIQNHGRIALSDPANLEGLLREAAGDSPEVNLVVMALRAGVPQALAAGSADVDGLALKLQAENFLAPEASQSAVAAWADALGITPAQAILESVTATPEVIASPPTETPAAEVPAAVAPAPPPVVPAFAAVPPPASQPAPAPIAAPPPQAPQVQAPAPQPQYNQYPSGGPHPGVAKGSNPAVLIAVIAVALLVVVGGAGIWWWTSHNTQTVAIRNTGGPTPTSGGTTGGGVATSGTNGSATGAMDLDGLNAKLTEWHKGFVEAGTEFQQKVTAASSLTDQNAQLDAMGDAYLKMSEKLEVMASDLDTLTPPAEAAAIVQKLAGNARDLSSKIGEGATAAKAHDTTKFLQNSTDIQQFGTERKAQLEGLVTGGGFDVEVFNSTGTLVKKA